MILFTTHENTIGNARNNPSHHSSFVLCSITCESSAGFELSRVASRTARQGLHRTIGFPFMFLNMALTPLSRTQHFWQTTRPHTAHFFPWSNPSGSWQSEHTPSRCWSGMGCDPKNYEATLWRKNERISLSCGVPTIGILAAHEFVGWRKSLNPDSYSRWNEYGQPNGLYYH